MGIKAELLARDQIGSDDAHRSSLSQHPLSDTITVVGMGGSGKTVVASAICYDKAVRAHFSQICFVAVGQPANGGSQLRDLQSQLHLQVLQ